MKTKVICAIIAIICIISICANAHNEVVTPTDLEPSQVVEDIIRLAPTVHIYWDAQPIMYEGDLVHIYSEITNGEYWDLTYQWYCSEDMIEWEAIPDATESIYTFEATKETLSYAYRLCVTYSVPKEEADESNIH